MMNKKDLIKFENDIKETFRQGKLPFLIHFSGGNEKELIKIFKNISENDYVFSTHRSHYHYLLKGGSQKKLKEKICNGNSMFIFDKKLKFFTSSILAGTTGIAAGVALAIKLKGGKQKVWCFLGDGAEDQGHFYEAVRYVDNLDLPCKFIIEDNDRSVESTKEMRSAKRTIKWPNCVIRYTYKSTYPHGGPGLKEMIKFDDNIVKKFESKEIHD